MKEERKWTVSRKKCEMGKRKVNGKRKEGKGKKSRTGR